MGAVADHPPLLWGDWRCTTSERMWVAECQACGGGLWVHRNGFDDWRVSCENGCAREAIDAAAHWQLLLQRATWEAERERKNAMDIDDPFHTIEAERYFPLLTGREATRGFVQCPFHGGGDERTPSLHLTGIFWHCHSCKRGGTIYDLGAELYGIEPRGDGFRELQRVLAERLLKVRA